jgi:hypothetical protein
MKATGGGVSGSSAASALEGAMRRVDKKDPDTLGYLRSYAGRRINKSYAMDRLGVVYYGQLLDLMGVAKLALPALPEDLLIEMVREAREFLGDSDRAKIVIPDAGVLMALAHGDILDMLFAGASSAVLGMTDFAVFGARHGSDQQDLDRINTFLSGHARKVSIEPTLLNEVIDQANAGLVPASKMAPYLGEMGMYNYLSGMYQKPTASPTVVLIEDEWFINRELPQADNLQVMSLMAFLRFVEQCNPLLFHETALAKMVAGHA